jgi:DNA-binding NarL/FixJ family response regulator
MEVDRTKVRLPPGGTSVERFDVAFLTKTERSVLDAYANGLTRKEIALALHLSVRTVGHALTSAKERLGSRSLAQAAVTFDRVHGA